MATKYLKMKSYNPFDSQAKMLSHIDRLVEYKKTGDSKPILLEVNLSGACNFKCPGCYAEDLKNATMLTKEQAIGFVDKYKPMHVNITGGEPLLHPKLYEIISGISKNVVVSMVTNGSLLTEEKVQKLKIKM